MIGVSFVFGITLKFSGADITHEGIILRFSLNLIARWSILLNH